MSTSDSHMMKAAELPAADRIRLKATFDLPPTSVHAAPAAPTHCRCHPAAATHPGADPHRCRCHIAAIAAQHPSISPTGCWAAGLLQ